MKQLSIRVWRGLLAFFLSLAVALMALGVVANDWRGVIDRVLGTSSTVTTSDDKFVSEFNSTDELIQAHIDLGERMAEEGVVLLKNSNDALPLGPSPRVTVFGMGAVYPFMGGTMGSMAGGAGQRDMISAMQERGYEINPELLDIYQTLGSIVTGEEQTWGGVRPIYGYRPANFTTPYQPSEPSIDLYTVSEAQGGAGASGDYINSFTDYSDAAIVVLSRPGSEGSDYYPGEKGIDSDVYKTDSALGLAANERAVLELAKEHFETVVVLINSGSTMQIEELKHDPGVDSIMYIGYPGAYGFLGVADVLSGAATPSGHLVDTYAVDLASSPAAQNFGKIALTDLSMITYPGSLMGDLSPTSPIGSFGGGASMAADHYLIEAEGIYTGYKYYETRFYDSVLGAGNASSAVGASNNASSWEYATEVSYSFGYGLSYTTFQQNLKSVDVDMEAKTITAVVSVRNTGNASGKSVAQLYVQTPFTERNIEHSVEKSAIDFLGMEKTSDLGPGEEETLTIVVDMKYLASWDSMAKNGRGGYILDGGEYFFAIGNGAHEAVTNILAAQNIDSFGGNADLVSIESIGTEGQTDESTFSYSDSGVEIVNQLEDADINYYLPGYATYLSRTDWEATFPRTYDDLEISGARLEEWVTNLANEVYQISENGEVNVEGIQGDLTLADLAGVDDIDDIRWDELVAQIPVDVLIAKIVKGGSVSDVIESINSPLVYQNDGPNGFAGSLGARGLNEDDPNASFTMGTMANAVLLASTFNKDLVLEWGELIGNDGLWSGNYSIWGAAANIHRAPFNGRNFEYYSEDPMLSNYMAAATVRGALNYGVIVGPKHIAFNDQETQRSGVAPYMTEQKAREGDLRAFQGAFEDANSLGAMTSFSRIGATPVNGSWGVLKSILREEWGFNGLLSTDMVNNSGYFRPEMAIYAGITQMADFSTDETMEDVIASWPYMTMNRISKDAQLVSYARENMKYQLYAFAQSAVQNVQTIRVTPWWETALNVSTYISIALALIALAIYISAVLKSNKEAK